MPTEDRFKKLGEDTKYLLFMGYVNTPSDEEIHRAYELQRNTAVITSNDERDFEALGYKPEQLERIKRNLVAAGIMMEEDDA